MPDPWAEQKSIGPHRKRDQMGQPDPGLVARHWKNTLDALKNLRGWLVVFRAWNKDLPFREVVRFGSSSIRTRSMIARLGR